MAAGNANCDAPGLVIISGKSRPKRLQLASWRSEQQRRTRRRLRRVKYTTCTLEYLQECLVTQEEPKVEYIDTQIWDSSNASESDNFVLNKIKMVKYEEHHSKLI